MRFSISKLLEMFVAMCAILFIAFLGFGLYLLYSLKIYTKLIYKAAKTKVMHKMICIEMIVDFVSSDNRVLLLGA